MKGALGIDKIKGYRLNYKLQFFYLSKLVYFFVYGKPWKLIK